MGLSLLTVAHAIHRGHDHPDVIQAIKLTSHDNISNPSSETEPPSQLDKWHRSSHDDGLGLLGDAIGSIRERHEHATKVEEAHLALAKAKEECELADHN